MSYTPMSDLGQQGLFDITRTLLQQPDLASLCEALSQLVKRSALADNAAIVLWQAQTQRASYYASREKDTPLNMKTKLFWHTVRYAAFCRALIRCIAVTKNFVKRPQLAAGGLYPKFGHYCLMPLAAEGHILVAVNLFVMTIAPERKRVQSSANIYADRFCRHRTNPEPRRQ